jgi:hypothetical protein
VAGITCLTRRGTRFSADIDIFHDRDDRIAQAGQQDTGTLPVSGPKPRDMETYLEAKHRNDHGLPVPQEMCPKRMWDNESSELETGLKAMPLPDLFRNGKYWMMSRRAADIFRKFDLGGGIRGNTKTVSCGICRVL